jgi:hypothetical protein
MHIPAGENTTYLNGSHMYAFLSALPACFRALLAMLIFVLTALFRTLLADLSTCAAKFFCPATAQAHQLRRGVTDGSTLHIQLYTFCHHFHILFIQAGGSTMVTKCYASQTGVDTFFKVMVIHKNCFIKAG